MMAAFFLPPRPGFAQANPDTYFLSSGFAPYNTIPLLLGNGFTATGGKATVTLIGNEASNTGYLYVVDPVTGEVRFLFSNKDAKGTVMDLGIYPKGAPVVFLYVADKAKMTPKKYTGANTAGNYDFDGDPALKGMAINHGAMPVSGETNNKEDHRWAIAGRANCSDVVFGFEDVAGGDYDYNDIVFLVGGVRLDSEIKLPAPVISGKTPFRDSATVTLTLPPLSPATTRIYFTVDGSAPSVNATGVPQGATREYLAPFLLTAEATVKAFTWKPNGSADSCGGSVVYAGSEVASTAFTKEKVTKTASGVYLDRNGDGRIDAARITLAAARDKLPAALTLEDPFQPGHTISVAPGRLSFDPADGLVLVAQFPEQPFQFGTAFPDGPYGRFPSGPEGYDDIPFVIRDAVGPVVISAEAKPSRPGTPDILKIVLSEDIKVEAGDKKFPFSALHPNGAEFGPGVVLTGVESLGGKGYEFTLAAGSGPQPGDSLKLIGVPTLTDTRGNQSNMGYYVPVGGLLTISIQGGDYVVGEKIDRPVPLKINVSVVEIVDPKTGRTGDCLDCRTGEWKSADPKRPDAFTRAPELKVSAKGGFDFDFRVFDHFGQVVNRAKGTVSEGMLRDVKADPQGYKNVALRWYPVSESGQHVGTGVYIMMGTVTVEPTQVQGPVGGTVRVGGSRDRINVRLGYVR
ncbi:MAG: hypothetical protein JWP91_2047 [Fibrobacteres bacterium]|nr:hypothetical protein [Fibrobacterota bacterium]